MPELLIPENKFRRLLRIGIALPFLLAFVFAMVLGEQLFALIRLSAAESAERDLVAQARETRTSYLEAETSREGYLLTSHKHYQNRFNEAIKNLGAKTKQLGALTLDEPAQFRVARTLIRDGDRWMDSALKEMESGPPFPRPGSMADDAARPDFDTLMASFQAFISQEEKTRTALSSAERRQELDMMWIAFAGIAILAALYAYCSSRLLRSVSENYTKVLAAHQRETERAKEMSGLYQLITENSGDLISVLNDGFIYTYTSPSFQRILGYESSQLINHSVMEFLHHDDLPSAQREWQRVKAEGTASALLRHRGSDGAWRWIDTIITKVDDKLVCVGRDVSEKRLAEEQIRTLNAELEQRVQERTSDLHLANKELEAFSFSVSHDLRAPLRSIASFSMILQEDLEGKLDEDSTDNLRRIRVAAQKMTELIDALLKFSRIARAELTKAPVNISEMAESIIAELERREPRTDIKVEVQPDMIAEADSALIRVVLQNLLENSWKFTSKTPEARISFTQQPDNGRVVFTLKDNGVGFDQDYVAKVFVPFERLHTDREFPGTGIGLASTKRIVERHGGRIWAQGERGKGAAFSFTL